MDITSADINDELFEIPVSLSHIDQVEKWGIAFDALVDIENALREEYEKARSESRGDDFLHADNELKRISQYWVPFIAAEQKAKKLVSGGHKIAAADGSLQPASSGYEPDPMITLFMIILDAYIKDFIDDAAEKLKELGTAPIKEWIEAIVQLTPGLRIIQDFRDNIIKAGNIELVQLLENPIKRPIEIAQSIRDAVIGDSSNEIAVLLRDPVKRPVQVITRALKNPKIPRVRIGKPRVTIARPRVTVKKPRVTIKKPRITL